MPVMIHGKQYVTVAERVAAAHGADLLSISTEVISAGEKQYIIKAIVRLKDGRTFTGHAEEIRGSQGIAGKSPLEVAETSAVGRALGFAGFGSVQSIASADEVKSAQSKPAPAPPPDEDVEQEFQERQGESKWNRETSLITKARAEIPYYEDNAYHIIGALNKLEKAGTISWMGSPMQEVFDALNAYAHKRANEKVAE